MKIGTKVKYYPIVSIKKDFKETIVTSEPWDICGTMCCKIEGVSGGVDIEHLEEIIEKKEWTMGPSGNMMLKFDDFHISYAINPGGEISFFAGDNDSDETALCKDGGFYILNGDFREVYEKLALSGGFDECLKYYKTREKELSSSWSTR